MFCFKFNTWRTRLNCCCTLVETRCFTHVINPEHIRDWSWGNSHRSRIYQGLVLNGLTNPCMSNFHPLEFVCRYHDPQLQVGENSMTYMRNNTTTGTHG